MIKSVTIINHLGESIKLELGRPEESGFLITEISGLGPVKANINFKEVATSDGSQYNSARKGNRNIVFYITYDYIPTIEDARQLSYKYFPVKKPIVMIFETDNRTAMTSGYVESNEPDIFSKEESTQISVLCPDPNFYALNNQTTVFSGIQPSFEMPFEDPIASSPSLEFGILQNSSEKNIVYDGDAEVGVTIYIHATGEATNVSITNAETRELMKIDTTKLATITGNGIIAGDDITINTIQGNKFITLLRAGVTYNIRNSLDIDVDWFTLVKGDNVFAFLADTGLTNLQFIVDNKIAYEGV